MPNERRVNRYELFLADTSTIRLPAGSKILSASSVGQRLFLYGEVDAATPTQYETHTTHAYKTGLAFHASPHARFLNSVFVPPDSAFHIYVEDETEKA